MQKLRADWILSNGNCYLSADSDPTSLSLAIHNGIILAVGTDAELECFSGEDTKHLNLASRTVLPGLIDAHIHLEKYGRSLDSVDCSTDSVPALLQRVEERLKRSIKGDWVLGHGWDQNRWERYGTRAELDRIAPHNPVYLTAKSLHAGWANSLALEQAGIRVDSEDPADGTYGRTEKGLLNGIVFEGAMHQLSDAIPLPSVEELVRQMLSAQRELWRFGITGIHDFDGTNCLRTVQRLRQQNRLGLRILKNIPWKALPDFSHAGIRGGFGDDWIRLGSVKLFADGALGPRTAAMLDPFEGEPENLGMLLLDGEEIFERGIEAADAGYGLTVHAIGDRANHEVLDAFEALRQREDEMNFTPHRHRIEHVQLIHPEDLPRLATLDLVASMQPIHAISDMEMADRYWGVRAEHAYAWRSQLGQGALLAFGSDAPVDSPNPFWGLHAALLRRQFDGKPAEGDWTPSQRLTLREALLAYTEGAAYAAGMENTQGKLHPGCYADLIILERDPFVQPAEELAATLPTATMVGGRWRSGEFLQLEEALQD